MSSSRTAREGSSPALLLVAALLATCPMATARAQLGDGGVFPKTCGGFDIGIDSQTYLVDQSAFLFRGHIGWAGARPCGEIDAGTWFFTSTVPVSNATCMPVMTELAVPVWNPVWRICEICSLFPFELLCCSDWAEPPAFGWRTVVVPPRRGGSYGVTVEYPSPGGCPVIVLRGIALQPGYAVRVTGKVQYRDPSVWVPFSLAVEGTGTATFTSSGCSAGGCNPIFCLGTAWERCGGEDSWAVRGAIAAGRAGASSSCVRPSVRLPPSTSAVMGVRGVLPTMTTLVRRLPADGWAARWMFSPEAGGDSQMVTDGPRAGGSVITGSESPVLGIKGFTELDAGIYTMLVIPPGGSVADAEIADHVTVVDDVGQPEIVSDLEEVELCGSNEATLSVGATGPGVLQYRWFIDGLQVLNGPWERDGLTMELEGVYGPELHITSIEGADGGSGRIFHAQCQVFNENGSTFSFMVPVTPGPRSTLEIDEARRVLKVTTETGEQPCDFSVTVARSHDLGRTWLPGVTPIRQGAFQRVVTEVPLSAPGECASDVDVRASCSAACGVLAAIDQSMIARAALSPCGPAGIDPSDFWCGSCPAQVAFAQSDFGTSDPYFVVRRAVPSSDWGVRWMFFAAGSDAAEWLPVTDGPTGRGSSVASGATTPELRIDAPSGLDAGTYAMIVTPPPTVCPYEFCAAQVSVQRRESIPPSCPRLVSNPASRTVCPDESDFTVSASFSVPGIPIGWYLDGYLRLEGDAGNIDVDNGPGDRVAFSFSGGTSGSVTILGYEAEGAHTLEAAPSTNCSPEGSLPAVLWPPASANRCGGCRPDLNGDEAVDGIDLGVLLAAWGPSSASADLNADGAVDGIDLGLLLAAWGACP